MLPFIICKGMTSITFHNSPFAQLEEIYGKLVSPANAVPPFSLINFNPSVSYQVIYSTYMYIYIYIKTVEWSSGTTYRCS